jgi:prepilin-type N-terminal cleavage/methylation domain-containing protein
MRNRKSDDRGFTLIEAIFTLLLVGITATLAGMWIVNVANGYIFAKMNADTVQKAQLAMTRLTKEFQSIQSVDTGASNASQITYTRADAATTVGVTATVSRSGSNLLINTDILTDNVSVFTLSYCNDNLVTPTCASVWSPASRIIEVTLTLSGAGNTTSAFTKRIAPRNL